jgi:hypothetical protein
MGLGISTAKPANENLNKKEGSINPFIKTSNNSSQNGPSGQPIQPTKVPASNIAKTELPNPNGVKLGGRSRSKKSKRKRRKSSKR